MSNGNLRVISITLQGYDMERRRDRILVALRMLRMALVNSLGFARWASNETRTGSGDTTNFINVKWDYDNSRTGFNE